MRLFVAIDVDDDTRAQLVAAREAMRAVLETVRVPPRITWVNEEAAHVTLRFIGHTTEATAAAVQSALTAGLQVAPFEVRWDHVGTFPPIRQRQGWPARTGARGGGNPRVIWMGLGAGHEPLATLAEQVNARLDPILGPGESRPFTAHLTIGRVKESGKRVDWGQVLSVVSIVPTTTRIDHVTLYQSRLSPRGPTYTPLCRANL